MHALTQYAYVLDSLRAAQTAPIRLDVKETADSYLVSAEIPGARKEDIAVEIEGDEVTLTAQTRREENAAEGKWLRAERLLGKSARRFALPQELDADRAQARFADGVLELTLPKKQTVAARRISVQ